MKNKISVYFLLLVIGLLVAGGYVLYLLNERELPSVTVNSEVDYLGLTGQVDFTVVDRESGVRAVQVFLQQGDKSVELLNETFARQGYFDKAGAHTLNRVVTIDTKSLGFKDGRADLVIEAIDFSFRNYMKGNRTVYNHPVMLDTVKPKVRVLDSPRYIRAGGSSIVLYEIDEPVVRHGVVINGHFYGGFPVSKKNSQLYGALLSLKYTTRKITEMMVEATDKAGNVGEMPFSMNLLPMRPRQDRIGVDDNFLDQKIPEFSHYYPDLPGQTKLQKYLYINRELRQINNDKIREITSKVTPEKFWDGVFGRLPGSSKRAGYADERTYYYHNAKVDHEVHLGIDLASVQRAPVPAANRGRIVFADYNGIYGNLVIIDHGWGLFSIYSHLSQINVKVGDMVDKGTVIALTGHTGMAGGDHLHFGMLVDGIFVNPLEWWDGSWLKLNILNYL
ncbi:MAG: M23 family metallopeptidase [Deltaproteobacteria bacterium]